jgi:hypothetical protein
MMLEKGALKKPCIGLSTFESDVLSGNSKFGMISSLQFQKPQAKTLYLLAKIFNFFSLRKGRCLLRREERKLELNISRINKN